MACELQMQCDLVHGFLKCSLPEDTVDVDLKFCTLKRYSYVQKDHKSQTTKYSLWGTQVQPCPSLKKKMVKFMWHWQTITTPFANRPYQPKLKIFVKK